MSLQIRDTISPGLARLAGGVSSSGRRSILEAMGLQLVSLTKRAFNNAELRPAPWRAKRDGSPATLKLHGTLWRSIRIAAVDGERVTVASDRVYAAIHQLGGVIRPKNSKALVFRAGGRLIFAKKVTIPARPFFPFTAEGEMIPQARRLIEAVGQRKLDSILRAAG